MNGNHPPGRHGQPAPVADPAHRGNGEGAGSALEAMLRKRQMRVNPEPDPAAAPTSPNQDGKTPGE